MILEQSRDAAAYVTAPDGRERLVYRYGWGNYAYVVNGTREIGFVLRRDSDGTYMVARPGQRDQGPYLDEDTAIMALIQSEERS